MAFHSQVVDGLPGASVHAPNSSAIVGLPQNADVREHMKGTNQGSRLPVDQSEYIGYPCITAMSTAPKISPAQSPLACWRLSACRPQVTGWNGSIDLISDVICSAHTMPERCEVGQPKLSGSLLRFQMPIAG